MPNAAEPRAANDAAAPLSPARVPATGTVPSSEGAPSIISSAKAMTAPSPVEPPSSTVRSLAEPAPAAAPEAPLANETPAKAPAAPAPAPGTATRRGPGQPPRRGALEDSVVTSAPKLQRDPAAKPAPPKAGGKGQGPAKSRDAKTQEAAAKAQDAAAKGQKPAPDVREPAAKAAEKTAEPAATPAQDAPPRTAAPVDDAALLATFRTPRDRSKSPGFYSTVSPPNGSHPVPSSISGAMKRATMMGVAPPPAAPKPAERVKSRAPHEASAEPRVALDTNAAPDLAPPTPDPASALQVVQEPLASDDSDAAPPVELAVARIEKEETSPGLGQPRSAPELPQNDLDLLVEFIMDLALGLASRSWLAPVRMALSRLRVAAAGGQRPALERALGELAVELEGSSELSEERRRRIVHQFVGVEMALPRPIDVAGQKALREKLIVEQLLGEVSLTHPLISQRVREEGNPTLERLARASADELADKLGTSRDQAELLVTTFRSYLDKRAERGPSLAMLGRHRALEARLSALATSDSLFQRALDGEDAGVKRSARRQRQADVAHLNLLLAELGEATLLAEIERCSVQGKIDRVTRWLSERAG